MASVGVANYFKCGLIEFCLQENPLSLHNMKPSLEVADHGRVISWGGLKNKNNLSLSGSHPFVIAKCLNCEGHLHQDIYPEKLC